MAKTEKKELKTRFFKNLNTGVIWDVGSDEHARYLAKDKANYEEVSEKDYLGSHGPAEDAPKK